MKELDTSLEECGLEEKYMKERYFVESSRNGKIFRDNITRRNIFFRQERRKEETTQ